MTVKRSLKLIKNTQEEDYSKIKKIDGSHPFKEKVPNGFVDYPARSREGGRVFYFNFELAKEMGLISPDHKHRINAELEQTILDTFSIVIINEYDEINNKVFDEKTIRPNKYMATRYLQLQHPNRQGKTSGDGRSIWNGIVKGKNGTTWDVSSCGTGATCLSPATAIHGRYFETGDPSISYGCGYAEVLDGVAQAILSQIYYKSEVPTERCLAIIEFEDGLAINVRAGKNLMRPSHFFFHLKQNSYKGVKSSVDYYIDRQVKNKEWPDFSKAKNKYKYLLDVVTETFAKITAMFESEYIFCWMDWDGDNILVDGGIIDYGSIRQFGLFHHEYRYDDDDRWSTSIDEQKKKARYIIQTFAQLVDFIMTKEKKNIKEFSRHPSLKKFDELFEEHKRRFLLYRLGFPRKFHDLILSKEKDLLDEFSKDFYYFERVTVKRGPRKVADGINTDAIFCMRDILREMPLHFLQTDELYSSEDFLEIIKSSYATPKLIELYKEKGVRIRRFQKNYINLVERCAKRFKKTPKFVFKSLAKRSRIINRYERVTGDSIVYIGQKIYRESKHLSIYQLNKLFEDFIENQILNPDSKLKGEGHDLSGEAKKIQDKLFKIVKEHREGI
jgi:uncharacterized protein YdiU (UPF0061 family)